MAKLGNVLSPRQSTRTLLAAALTAVLVAVVVQQSWSGQPITFDSVLFFLLVGVTLGSIYAVAAQGLVVTYTTSGVFNFAQGAIGHVHDLRLLGAEGRPRPPDRARARCSPCSSRAPLLGAVIERILMRRLIDAPLVAKLVVTIGLDARADRPRGRASGTRTTRGRSGTFFGVSRLRRSARPSCRGTGSSRS